VQTNASKRPALLEAFGDLTNDGRNPVEEAAMACQVVHDIQLVRVTDRMTKHNNCKGNVVKYVTSFTENTISLAIAGAVCGWNYKHRKGVNLERLMTTNNANDLFARRFKARLWRYLRLFVLHPGRHNLEKIWKGVMFSSIQWMTNVSNGRGAFPIWSNKWVNSLPTTYKNETMCSGHNLEMLKVLDRIVPGLLQKITNCHSNKRIPEDQVMPEEAIKSNSYIWKEERYWTENSG
jgi:hypothetical protein